jgi:nucleolar complex protein 3
MVKVLMVQDAEMVLQSIIDVFRSDNTSLYSQTLVRLIARMIKERKFQVHPNILSSLLHLRLRSELDMMRDRKSRAANAGNRDSKGEKIKGKFKSEIRKKWQTKNQKKREKEMKEVEKEMAEAAAEVDTEERAKVVSLMSDPPSCLRLSMRITLTHHSKPRH